MTQPLQGVRVVDLSHVIAGPLASMYLAQLGAEVIKVEPVIGGEVMRANRKSSAGFVALNAGKRSLAVDIRQAAGADLVRRLAASADVFIENFRPGTLARRGLAYDDIRAVRPNVIYCSLSGYGQQGDWAGRGAYDHVVQALTGMMMMSGDSEDAPPAKVGFPVVDVAVGMLGALSISAALHRRTACGEGQHIDASMVQAALMLMYPNVSNYMNTGEAPRRAGNRGYTGSPGADTWRCTDGWLSTAANTPGQFKVLAQVLGLERLCEDDTLLDTAAFEVASGGFVQARAPDIVLQLLRDAFASRSAHDMEEQLNARGVPAARVRRLGEFLDETADGTRLARTNLHYRDGETTVRTAGMGFLYQHEPMRGGGALAPLGADNDALLAGLGLDAGAIDTLRRDGVVR
ncbi:MAG: CoA transferase [Comamonadaceae bacterium]|nr:MAG: CoA transferase [Comamonadaceae bacterium]